LFEKFVSEVHLSCELLECAFEGEKRLNYIMRLSSNGMAKLRAEKKKAK